MSVFRKKLTRLALIGCPSFLLCEASLRGELELTSDQPIVYDHQTQQLRATGGARLVYQGNLLTANEILYNQEQLRATAKGNVLVSNPELRLVGDQVHYHVPTRSISGENLRFGQPPFFASARSADAGPDLVELDGAIAYFGEPRPGAINLRAGSLRYFPEERIEAENVTVRIGRVPVFYLPRVGRGINGALSTTATAAAGYSDNLGGYGFVATRTPVWSGVAVGPEIGFYHRRGLLVGPGFDYRWLGEESRIEGSLRGGFIGDRGELGTDRIGRLIDDQRYYGEWRHQQTIGDQIEITGVVDLWSDSEVTRDFRPRLFSQNQFPSHFLEAAYSGQGSIVSVFTQISPNDFEIVPERLPEIRYDLFPRPLGQPHIGLYHQLQASATVLRENDPTAPDTRSDRFDLYYSVNRPFLLADWLTFTPKAGARLTHYQRALDERSHYTRVLGEIGADVEGTAFAVYHYQNELWKIDDIRHLVKPRLHYRYIPRADQGRRFIPQVDRQVFATHLEPIDLGQTRNIDQLDETHTLRYGLDNIFQTRHPTYGSNNLLSVFVANDLRFSRQPGQEFVSDIHTELSFTPVYWFRFDALNRLSPQDPATREMNTGLTITDARFWSLRFGSEFVEDRLEEYSLFFTRRLNETYRMAAEIRYDAIRHRFSRQTYTLTQNLYGTWDVNYQIFLRTGTERESPFGAALSFSYLSF
jgi:LPS-assembly protein